MSRRHHHHMQPYDYDRFSSDHSRDRERERNQARGIEYQDDSLSSINSDEESYLHHQPQHTPKEKKTNFYTAKTETSKSSKVDKPANDSYHQKEKTQQHGQQSAQDPTAERLARLEGMIEQLIKRNNPAPPAEQPVVEKASSERRGQFCLEPRRHDFTTSMWINKIQEISIQNNWDEKTIISYMGSQMSGIIKAWYNSLPNYDYTWPEWKILITKMFPDNTDFVTSLKRLVTRLKQGDESMTTYYFSKMYLIEACKITGEDAVSCLIDGLNNQSIQEQAKVQNYLTPETLYSQFLMVLPEYTVDYSPQTTDTVLNNWYYQDQEPNVEEVEAEVSVPEEGDIFQYEKTHREEEFEYRSQQEEPSRSLSSLAKRSIPVHSRLDMRFVKSSGFRHQNKIPMAAKVCTICSNRGHLARNCRKAKAMFCKLVDEEPSNCFTKECLVNDRKFDSFVDTGCTTVIIKEGVARTLDLNIVDSCNRLEVYGGGLIPVIGETEIVLQVDSVRDRVRAVVVPNNAQEASVVIGQPFLNQENVFVVLQNSKIFFLRRSIN